MSIVPIASVSSSDLALLGNNLIGEARKDTRDLRAVNRSLAVHDEQVGRLRRVQPWPLARVRRKAADA